MMSIAATMATTRALMAWIHDCCVSCFRHESHVFLDDDRHLDDGVVVPRHVLHRLGVQVADVAAGGRPFRAYHLPAVVATHPRLVASEACGFRLGEFLLLWSVLRPPCASSFYGRIGMLSCPKISPKAFCSTSRSSTSRLNFSGFTPSLLSAITSNTRAGDNFTKLAGMFLSVE